MSNKRATQCLFSICLAFLCTTLSISPSYSESLDKQAAPSATGGWKAIASSPQNQQYLQSLQAAERKYGIPRDMLVRVAYQESRFRPDIISGKVVSPAGAVGIMQIIPACHPGVDPLNPPEAIDYAGRYLRELVDEFGSWDLALAAYNWGPGNLRRFGLNKAPRETRLYSASIVGKPATAEPANSGSRVAAATIARVTTPTPRGQPAVVQALVKQARSMFDSARKLLQAVKSAPQPASQAVWLHESR
jgi:soluble lytic murein transglycosylase-like protein